MVALQDSIWLKSHFSPWIPRRQKGWHKGDVYKEVPGAERGVLNKIQRHYWLMCVRLHALQSRTKTWALGSGSRKKRGLGVSSASHAFLPLPYLLYWNFLLVYRLLDPPLLLGMVTCSTLLLFLP